MTTFVPLLSATQIEQLPPRAQEVVEYRKSGLNLIHIQGCPLDCAYRIRRSVLPRVRPHTFQLPAQHVAGGILDRLIAFFAAPAVQPCTNTAR